MKKVILSVCVLLAIVWESPLCMAQTVPGTTQKVCAKNYRLALVTKVQKAMSLTFEQYTAIKKKKKELDSILVVNPNFDYWKHERENLQQILNEKQFDIFLNFKNAWTACKEARGAWNELKERGLTEGYDSVRVVREIADYRLERLKLYDRYAYSDRQRYNELAAELYRNFCPNALRKLNGIWAVETKEKAYQGNIPE